jgi:hypothetical protein
MPSRTQPPSMLTSRLRWQWQGCQHQLRPRCGDDFWHCRVRCSCPEVHSAAEPDAAGSMLPSRLSWQRRAALKAWPWRTLRGERSCPRRRPRDRAGRAVLPHQLRLAGGSQLPSRTQLPHEKETRLVMELRRKLPVVVQQSCA